MLKVLFVCTGNICRSPTAEAIFKAKLATTGLMEHFEVKSVGTHAYHIGGPADPRSQETAKKNALDLSQHCAQQVTVADCQDFDYILAMDHYNIACLHDICPREWQPKIQLLLSYLKVNNIGDEVPDPYYGAGDGFQFVFELLSQALTDFLDFVKIQHKL